MKQFFVKPISKTKLAELYGVNLRILKNWMEPFKKQIGEPRGWYYTPKQLRIIFRCIGYPDLKRLSEL